MLKKLAYVIIILVGCYILYQIPAVKNFADGVKDSVLQKRDNVVEEYDRVKGKITDTKENVEETIDTVDETVDKVGEAMEKVGDAMDSVGDLFGGDEDEEEDEIFTCTEEQKAAEICTMDYTPVCGDDNVTYGNACQACASGNVDTYTPGECAGG